jgi:hypothetical protein
LNGNDPNFNALTEDTKCRTALGDKYGSQEDRNYAFCDETKSPGVCRRASERPTCGGYCSRAEWCRKENSQVCQGGGSNAVCAGGNCVGSTTTTTLSSRTCTASSCKYITSIGSYSKGADVQWLQDKVGTWMPCVNGRGCPSDTGDTTGTVKMDPNKVCADSTDPVTCPYIYIGCEIHNTDGSVKTTGCGEGLFCGTDNKCYSLVNDGDICGAAIWGQTYLGGRTGDVICKNFNCMGDYYKQPSTVPIYPRCGGYEVKCKANADATTQADEIIDPENYCHCEVLEDTTGQSFSIGGISRDKGIAAIRDNQKWCQDNTIPGFKEVDGYKQGACLPRRDKDETCAYSFQCKKEYTCDQETGKCSGGSGKIPKNGVCIVTNTKGDTGANAIWNRYSNGETEESTLWTDNCDDSGQEQLYCDPCDHATGLIDTRVGSGQCVDKTVKSGTKGICRAAQGASEWCYSNGQCDQKQVADADGFKQLFCSGSRFCDSTIHPNKYCEGKDSSYYNKKCTYGEPSGGCYHDAMNADDRFLQKADEQCWEQQYMARTLASSGDPPSDYFCNDADMCKTGTSTASKFCGDVTGTKIHELGQCEVNYCPKSSLPYILNDDGTSDCMRSPGYYNPTNPISGHHHVAMPTTDASRSLVYCDGTTGKVDDTALGGQCRWRKEKGKSCIHDVECMPDLNCISGVCNQNSCDVDDDCPSGQTCESGYCVAKQIYGFKVTAVNGLSKPLNTPFDGKYDFVVACDKKDYIYRYSADVSMKVRYSIEGGDEKPFGDSQVISATGAGQIPELCDLVGLSDNTKGNKEGSDNGKPYYIVKVNFIPVISGSVDKSLIVTKNVLVLSKTMSIKVVRCDGKYGVLTQEAIACGKTDSSGKPYDRDTMLLIQNNSVNIHQVGTNQQVTVKEDRYISCVAATEIGVPYNLLVPPKKTVDMFPPSLYATVEDWNKAKYYKCTDQYGTVKEGSLLVNPVEWIFNYELTDRGRLLLILIVFLGIPTLVLAGSRARRG